MGSLSATLLHLDISGHMGTRFPLALTQLVALEHLSARGNEFAELPAGITALSRLTELMLGRVITMMTHYSCVGSVLWMCAPWETCPASQRLCKLTL